MGQIYTSGDWLVKEGCEEEFIAAWEEMASWTAKTIETATWANLLRDDENPRLFRSFGPWDSRETVALWREMSGFRERVGSIRELIESLDAKTMEVAVAIG